MWINGKLSAINLPSATKVVNTLTFSTSNYFSFIYFALVTLFHEPLEGGVGGLIIDLESGWEMTNRKGLQGKQDKGRTESDLHKENPQMTYYFPVHEKTKENKLRKSLELEKIMRIVQFPLLWNAWNTASPRISSNHIFIWHLSFTSAYFCNFFYQAKFAKLINV